MQGLSGLEEIACFCTETGLAGREKVLLHYLQRINRLNPLLSAVVEVGSFQHLRSLQEGQGARDTPSHYHSIAAEAIFGAKVAGRTAAVSETADAVHKDADPKVTVERKRPGDCPVAVDAGPQLDAFQGVDHKVAGSQERHGALRAQQKFALGTGGTQEAQIEQRSLPFSKQSPLHKESPPSNGSPLSEMSVKDPVYKATRPLEGIPFLVKDVIDVAGFCTVAGCELLLGSPPVQLSASIVQNLQTLGAVPLGKSAVPEACSQKRVDVQTFSRVHGVTRNPYRFDLTPGGSSGGSAVAVAAGMVPLAVGTDWAGSLRIPAAFCGVCTLRASCGRMTIQHPERTVPPMPRPRPNEVGPSDGQIMSAGVFTRTVRDLRYAMDHLLAPSRTLVTPTIQSAVFAVTPSLPSVATDVRIPEALQQLPALLQTRDGNEACSAKLSAGPSLRTEDIWKAYGIFSASLVGQGDPHDPGAPQPALPSQEEVRWAQAVQVETASTVDRFLEEEQCTAWILPVCGTLPFEHNPEHKRFQLSGHAKAAPYWPTMLGYVLPFSVSCNPVVVMPLKLVEGRPCGLQVVGRSGCDEELLSACVLLESLLGAFPLAEEVNPQLKEPTCRL